MKHKILILTMILAIAIIPSAQAALPVEDGLIAYWTFDATEHSSTQADTIIGDDYCVLGNGTAETKPTQTTGRINEGYYFDRFVFWDGNSAGDTQQFMYCGNDTGGFDLTNYTVEAWVKINCTTLGDGSYTAFSLWDNTFGTGGYDSDDGFQFGIRRAPATYSEVWWYYYNDSVDNWIDFGSYSNQTIMCDQWVHIAMTFDNSTQNISIWENGNVVGSESSFANDGLGAGSPLAIGSAYGNDGSGYMTTTDEFNGVIDEVKVYNRPLSAAEIQQNYLADDNDLFPAAAPSTTPSAPSGSSLFCGDGICKFPENYERCPQDCPKPLGVEEEIEEQPAEEPEAPTDILTQISEGITNFFSWLVSLVGG